jgi:hypothetical protein
VTDQVSHPYETTGNITVSAYINEYEELVLEEALIKARKNIGQLRKDTL